ncbi:MAG: hypothetical protein ACXAD7_26180 [Candidatus Kariarchaeaceae archaeon]
MSSEDDRIKLEWYPGSQIRWYVSRIDGIIRLLLVFIAILGGSLKLLNDSLGEMVNVIINLPLIFILAYFIYAIIRNDVDGRLTTILLLFGYLNATIYFTLDNILARNPTDRSFQRIELSLNQNLIIPSLYIFLLFTISYALTIFLYHVIIKVVKVNFEKLWFEYEEASWKKEENPVLIKRTLTKFSDELQDRNPRNFYVVVVWVIIFMAVNSLNYTGFSPQEWIIGIFLGILMGLIVLGGYIYISKPIKSYLSESN